MSSSDELLKPPLSVPDLSVRGRYFLITGGTQGLGLAIARSLRLSGAAGLVLVSRSRDKGNAAVQELSTIPGDYSCEVHFVQADLSQAAECQAVFPQVEKLLGPGKVITGLVNAAAVTSRGNLFTTTPELFGLHMAINVRAPWLMTQGAAAHMKLHQATGSVVNICSVAVHGGAPFVMAYSASKAALQCLTINNAAELAPVGIRVNGINMGWCYTDNEDKLQAARSGENWVDAADATVPLGRILRPADVAATVVFLLSSASNMITGSVIEQHAEYPLGMLSLAASEDSR